MIHHEHFDNAPATLRRFDPARNSAAFELYELDGDDVVAAEPDFEFMTTARAVGAGELALEDDTQVTLTVAALHAFDGDL